jgi:hypothetical protein
VESRDGGAAGLKLTVLLAMTVQARTLLQFLEGGAPSDADADAAETILAVILRRISARSADDWSSWDGHLRGMNSAQLPAALWELVSRRWLPIFE